MLEFSYWLFPIIFIGFLFFPASRQVLLPGLIAACIAGSANSIAIQKPLFAWGHALAAMAFVVIWNYKCSQKAACLKASTGSEIKQRVLSPILWAAVACTISYSLPAHMWPYKLSKLQMCQLFVMFLPLGATIWVPLIITKSTSGECRQFFDFIRTNCDGRFIDFNWAR